MKKSILLLCLICMVFISGCSFSKPDVKIEKPMANIVPTEAETKESMEKIEKKPIVKNACDFVGKTANEVFEVLGNSYKIVGTESGAMQFVCDSCPDLMFCIVPIDWSGINGVEEIEYIVPFNHGKVNDYLKSGMTAGEIEEALKTMPDVQFSIIETYYTEMDEMNITRFLIQSTDMEFVYEWYEKDCYAEPSDMVTIKEKEARYEEDSTEANEYIYEETTQF